MNAAIPSTLIPPLRAALVSQGFPAETIKGDGTLNPAGLLAGVFDTIEIRTSATPNIVMRTQELLNEEEAPPNPVTVWLRPTIILRGKGGETIIAPLGVSKGGSILPMALAALAFVGVGYALAKAT
jgi:hypothetical protein